MNRKLFVAMVALAALGGRPAPAQEPEHAPRFQLAPYAGAYVPTGDQRDLLEDALLVGIEGVWDLTPYLAAVGSFAWAPTQTKALSQDLDLFQYDLGLQGQYRMDIGRTVLKPFVGAGLGARTYSFRDLDVSSETDLAGYVALGGNVELRNVAVGITVRDYITAFDGIGAEGESSTRNDLGLFASVGLIF